MNPRENLIKAYRFRGPEWIPIASGLPFLDWKDFGYDEKELEAICIRHPILFPGYEEGTLKRNHERVFETLPDMVADRPYTDGWGCVWETKVTGMVGAVKHHPLADWNGFEAYRAPDAEKTDGLRELDWAALAAGAEEGRRNGSFTTFSIPHGHTFLKAQDIRGYENLIFDMTDEEPRLVELLDRITRFHCGLISRFIALKPDMISIPEDLGMQNTPMLSAEQFRTYIAPCYDRLTKPIKAEGILVHEHSDGYILPLMDDIIRTGGDVINMQDLANGIDNIAKQVKGRIAIDLDIDRQNITVFGSVKDIDDHIRECVSKLSAPQGGLSLCYQPWPPVSPGNLDAVFGAMEKYCVTEYCAL